MFLISVFLILQRSCYLLQSRVRTEQPTGKEQAWPKNEKAQKQYGRTGLRNLNTIYGHAKN